jgi:hypothetical protein
VTWIRVALGGLGAAATAAALVVPAPGVFAFAGVAGIVAFILAAGCIDADAVPYRPAHLACAVASLPVAVLLAVGGRAIGLPVAVPAAALALLQAAPGVWVRRVARTRGART